jgi:hypothetical protein
MKRSFLSLTVLTLGLILSSNFSGLVKLSDDGAYAQEKVELSRNRPIAYKKIKGLGFETAGS